MVLYQCNAGSKKNKYETCISSGYTDSYNLQIYVASVY